MSKSIEVSGCRVRIAHRVRSQFTEIQRAPCAPYKRMARYRALRAFWHGIREEPHEYLALRHLTGRFI